MIFRALPPPSAAGPDLGEHLAQVRPEMVDDVVAGLVAVGKAFHEGHRDHVADFGIRCLCLLPIQVGEHRNPVELAVLLVTEVGTYYCVHQFHVLEQV